MSMPQAAAVFSVYKVRAKYSAFERKSCREKFTDLDRQLFVSAPRKWAADGDLQSGGFPQQLWITMLASAGRLTRHPPHSCRSTDCRICQQLKSRIFRILRFFEFETLEALPYSVLKADWQFLARQSFALGQHWFELSTIFYLDFSVLTSSYVFSEKTQWRCLFQLMRRRASNCVTLPLLASRLQHAGEPSVRTVKVIRGPLLYTCKGLNDLSSDFVVCFGGRQTVERAITSHTSQ
jgi:hypothetical protein